MIDLIGGKWDDKKTAREDVISISPSLTDSRTGGSQNG